MKTSKLLHWLPRIICILAILFLSLFALDSFSPERTLMQNISIFLTHLIPSFCLILILIIAWKWEKTGGILLTVAGLAWTVFVFILNLKRTHSVAASLMIILILGFPFILSGILFITSSNSKNS
jgi:hypothetical protein